MDYRDWEQKIKQKLEDASQEDSGYSVNAKEIWKEISEHNKPPKRTLFLFQPIATHVAATFLGILIATLAYFLFLHNPKRQKAAVALTKDAQEGLPIILHKTNEQKQEHPEKSRTTAVKNINPNHSDNIAATQHRRLDQKTSQTAIKPEITKDTVEKYANINPNPNRKQQQAAALATPKVMHWSDIEERYKNKSEPKYWAKLVRRIDKRLEKDEQSQDSKAPMLVWIETFK